jgi:hypothetical protein
MSGDSGDRVGRAYRAAGETLGERPSAAARAAILAAAARQIHAAPRDASAPIASPARRMPRWPMAAAAAVLLSTLAVMMAVRTEHEMGTFTPPAGSEAPRAQAPAAAPAAPSIAAAPAADPAGQDATASVARERALAKDRTVVATAPAEPPAGARADAKRRDAAQVAESKVTAPIAEPRAKEEAAALSLPASAPPAAPQVADQRAAPTPSAAAADAASAEAPASAADRRRNAAGSLARAPERQAAGGALGAAAEKPRAEMDTPVNELRAEEWLERIIELRQAGRHDDADAELKRFRERHPQVQIPAAALPPSGTR